MAENLFSVLGIRQSGAKILKYMALHEEVTSDELEMAIEISQPSISISIKELIEHGWVKVDFIRAEGKGRPRHLYSLSKPFPKVVDDIEHNAKNLITKLEKGVEFFREL